MQYTPDEASNYYLSTTISGWNTAQTIDSSYDPSEWRVMEIDEEGNIIKLFGVQSKGSNSNGVRINLMGAVGYNNGVYLLNDICEKRYSNVSLGTTARNLTIEDIELHMNKKGISVRNAYKLGTVQYGTTKKYTGNYAIYPAIYAQEKYSGINVSTVSDNTQILTNSAQTIAKSKMNPNGKTQSEKIYTSSTTETTGASVANLTCTQTYYYLDNISSSYFDNENFYSLIFESTPYLWLASRWVGCSNQYAAFGLACIYKNDIRIGSLFMSNGTSLNFTQRLAPVVSIKPDIKIKSGTGTSGDPYILGK